MMKRAALMAFAAALSAAMVVRGDGVVTANWLPTAAGTYTLTDGANWDTGVAPTNGIDTPTSRRARSRARRSSLSRAFPITAPGT